MSNHRRSESLNPHHIPNVAKYRAIAARSTTWARMVNSMRVDPTSGCWVWTKALNEGGYGIFTHHEYGPVMAHRLALHVAGRPVPVDKVVDHLCRNRACVNSRHLDIVTSAENDLRGIGYYAVNARKTHCPHGHEYSDENTQWYFVRRSNGFSGWTRSCKACAAARYRRSRLTRAA